MGDFYRQLLNSMPTGIKRDIIATLLLHIGEENAISGSELVSKLRPYYRQKNLHRMIRLEIQNLRNSGFAVASNASGKNPGYFLPQNRQEFDQFLDREITSRIHSLSVTKNRLISTADRIYGQAYQEGLL
jgi:biotin operon repressor